MARKQVARRESLLGLENAPQLRPFILSDVRSTGENLGRGSYGTVGELEINGLICAGKKLFDALIDPVNQGAQQIFDKYYNECSLLSNLRHPNVVQFLGICFLPETRLPVLVMERLDGSLDELLESTPDIPLHVKVSILQDVTRGLVYLHNHKPPIIHRDLTARNVLLTPAMTAKVADLGNSRKLAKNMTRGIPGTLVYMPPEASDESNKYGTSLDMFSFGHLSLFTAIQEFPEDLLPSTFRDAKAKELKGRTPLERRGVYIHKLHKILDPKHALVVLIKGCLEYDADKRPTARQTLDRLVAVKASIPPTPYSELNKLQLEMALKQKEAELKAKQDNVPAEREKRALDEERLRQENKSFVENCRRLGKANHSLKEEIHHLMKEKEELKEKMEATEAQVQIFEEDFKAEREDRERAHSQMNELEEKFKKEVMRLQHELEHTRQQLSSHKGNLSGLENVHKERLTEWIHTMDELKKAQDEIRTKSSQVRQYKKQLDTVTAKTSSLEKEREEIETQFELLRRAAERQTMKFLIKTETKDLSKKASGSQLNSKVPEQPFAAEGRKEQVGKLVVENAELQQQVSTLRAKLEKTAKKLIKAEEKKKKKASTSDILVSSPVSDSDMSTELELSQVKDLCMQLHDQNDDLQAEVRTLNDVNKTLKQCYIELLGSNVQAASTQSTKQESGVQHGGVHGAAAIKDVTEPKARSQSMFEESRETAGKGKLLSSKHASHFRFIAKKERATVLHDSKTKQNLGQQDTVSSGHPHYQQGSEEYEQQRKSPPTDQQNADYVNQSRVQAMFEEMKVRKHQQKFPESQHSASLVEANSFDLPPPMVDFSSDQPMNFPPPIVDFSSDQPMNFPQTTMGQGRDNAGHNQDAYGGGGGGHVGGGGTGRRVGDVELMGGGAHVQEELLRKQQQQGIKQHQTHTQMQEAVEYMLEDGEGRVEVTGLHAPLDPNLTCPACQTVFRLGEIQLFRSHVSTCDSVV